MSNRNRDRGLDFERQVETRARKKGIPANRQPGSGIYANFPADIVFFPETGEATLGECKSRTLKIPVKDNKGQGSLRIEWQWLTGLREKAHKAKMAFCVLVVNAKGSHNPLVIIDLDHYLQLRKLCAGRLEVEQESEHPEGAADQQGETQAQLVPGQRSRRKSRQDTQANQQGEASVPALKPSPVKRLVRQRKGKKHGEGPS